MTTATVSTLDFPSVRVAEPVRCAVCDTLMPDGWYATVADGERHVCSASCLASVPTAPVFKVGGERLSREALRERIADLRMEAESLRDEARDLEREADALAEQLGEDDE